MYIKIKYTPNNYSEVIYNKDLLEKLYSILKNPDHSNIIISGPKNSGKNLLLDMCMNKIYPKYYSNISDNVKDNIYYKYSDLHYHFNLNFMSKWESFSPIIKDIINTDNNFIDYPYNIIILDNFHNINSIFQKYLKKILEYNTIKIIIITNNISSVIAPLKSRCNHFKVPIITSNIIKFVNYVNNNEINEINNYSTSHYIKPHVLSSTIINKICFKYNSIFSLNINNILEDIDIYYNTGKIQDNIWITIIDKIITLICKKKLNQQNIDTLKDIAHNILIIDHDAKIFIKIFLVQLLLMKKNTVVGKEKIFIELFCDIELKLLKSYRKLIYIEALLFNVHRILLGI